MARYGSDQAQASGWEPVELPGLPAGNPRRVYITAGNRIVVATDAYDESPAGGVCMLRDGQWEVVFNQEQWLPHHRVWELAFEDDDTVWAATSYGLARIGAEGQTSTYTSLNSGLPSDRVNPEFVLNDKLWVGTEQGIASLQL